MKLSDIACHISGVKRCNWRCFLGEAAEVHSLVEAPAIRRKRFFARWSFILDPVSYVHERVDEGKRLLIAGCS